MDKRALKSKNAIIATFLALIKKIPGNGSRSKSFAKKLTSINRLFTRTTGTCAICTNSSKTS